VSSAYAEEIVPMFTPYAERALDLAGVRAGMRVLDVACGPGTLSFLAAARGASVDALDFSPGMVEHLRARAARDSVDRVTAQIGDGQDLPFDDGVYDAAFSMFGLMFFPDRARGFGELRRCLKDGCAAVVSSWQPMETNVPFCATMFSVLREHVPGLPFGGSDPPLAAQPVFAEEMRAAGFRDVEVHEVRYSFDMPSTAEGFASMERTMAPLAMLSRKMGPAWTAVRDKMYASLAARFGRGPQSITMPAWLGRGVR
jgi:ubiquinone/menaquinone biosynthesis C-methylase UbiE